eukprot:Pgem_evm1s11995
MKLLSKRKSLILVNDETLSFSQIYSGKIDEYISLSNVGYVDKWINLTIIQ